MTKNVRHDLEKFAVAGAQATFLLEDDNSPSSVYHRMGLVISLDSVETVFDRSMAIDGTQGNRELLHALKLIKNAGIEPNVILMHSDTISKIEAGSVTYADARFSGVQLSARTSQQSTEFWKRLESTFNALWAVA